MKSINLIDLETKRKEHLKKFGIDDETIKEYKSKIKQKGNRDELSKELYDLISSKNFNEKESVEKITELIITGADVDYHEEKKGNFPLLICCRKGYEVLFTMLIRFGADVNNKNNYGTTALMAASIHGYYSLVDLLIEKGADIDARCIDGDNSLDSAKRHNELDCIRSLKKASCNLLPYDYNIKSKKVKTTHELAMNEIENANIELEKIYKK